jgi:hypothetical protein
LVRTELASGKFKYELRDEHPDGDDNEPSNEDLPNEKEVKELPTCETKRQLYARLARQCGYSLKINAIGQRIGKDPLPGMEEKDCKSLPSWAAFLNFWSQNSSHIVIQKPSEDICGDCFTFANRHKHYIQLQDNRKRRKLNDDIEEEEHTEQQNRMIESERLIEEAAKHVMMAKKQRELFNYKKQRAIADAISIPPSPKEYRVMTWVADYAQNMYLPNFKSEQPGETYYYSPLNVYCFGIVDCSQEPSKLYAYNYTEDIGKKGGNNVSSLLWMRLKESNLVPRSYDIANSFEHKPIHEMNFVFDNCGGQNKNRMVLRLLFFLVKLKVCTIANAIFLVRGHTKNDCDRMFNIMKKSYRKKNVYVPEDLLACVNAHEDVDAKLLGTDSFYDWDKLETKLMIKPPKIKNNHIFTVDATRDSNQLYVRQYDGGPESSTVMVRKPYREVEDWYQYLNELEVIEAPGMPDIKWKELYDKWQPLVPQDKRNDYKYYSMDLPKGIRDKIKDNTKKAKETRQERGRGASASLNKSTTKSSDKKDLAEDDEDSPMRCGRIL